MSERFLQIILALVVALAVPAIAPAQTARGLPEVAEGIGVDQRVGESLPIDLEFNDDKGNQVYIADLFDGERPVLLSFNYSDCPQLCVVQLNNLASALQRIDLEPGKDFHIVSVSLDPNEPLKKLANTKRNYVVSYGKLESSDGWHFLRGSPENIRALADACGFRYKYVPSQKIYSHPAAFIFCTPNGRIARYLDGLSGELENTLEPALIEAGEGKVGSVIDRLMYFSGCYVFDPEHGVYTASAMGLMRIAAIGTVVALAIGLIPYWIRRQSPDAAAADETAGHAIEETETTAAP
jgi:protein SCO1/2